MSVEDADVEDDAGKTEGGGRTDVAPDGPTVGPASLAGAARPRALDLEGEGRAENFSVGPASFHF